MTADWTADSEFIEGVALFNAGRFFEAHEVWEIVWKRTTGAEKTLVQGLIQAAAALVHVERGNLRGAQSVSAKARVRLTSLPDIDDGIAIGELVRAMDEAIAAALRGEAFLKPQLSLSRRTS